MNKLINFIKKREEIIVYILFGGLTTIVCWGSYSLFVYLLHSLQRSEMVSIVLANIFSWISATIFSFVTNKIFVFKSRSWQKTVSIPEAIKFISSRFVTGVIEFILVPALVFIGLNQTICGIEGMLSKVIVSIFVVISNYIISKNFIFKDS